MKRLIAVVLLLLSQVSFAKGDVKAGQAKSSTCMACHGPDGNSLQGMWPKIAGQHAKYLRAQLVAFKKGEKGGRYNASMAPMVANLSDQDMADLAAFYASQKTTIEKANPKILALGERIYRGGNLKTKVAACIACHGPKGSGNGPAMFPRIGGQHSQYIVTQLKAYKDGTRKTGNSFIMADIAKRMSLEEMQAVANYCSALS